MVAFLRVRVDVLGEVIGTEIGESGVLVGEQVPDDDEDGAPDGDDRAFLAASSGDAPVAFAEEGVGSCGAYGRLAEDAGQVAVAVPGGAVALGLAGRGADAGGELRPRTQVPRGGEPGHVHPDLGDDHGGGDRPDAGDLIQACRRRRERGQIRLDLFVDGGDVGVDAVDAVQHPLQAGTGDARRSGR